MSKLAFIVCTLFPLFSQATTVGEIYDYHGQISSLTSFVEYQTEIINDPESTPQQVSDAAAARNSANEELDGVRAIEVGASKENMNSFAQ